MKLGRMKLKKVSRTCCQTDLQLRSGRYTLPRPQPSAGAPVITKKCPAGRAFLKEYPYLIVRTKARCLLFKTSHSIVSCQAHSWGESPPRPPPSPYPHPQWPFQKEYPFLLRALFQKIKRSSLAKTTSSIQLIRVISSSVSF